MKIEQYIDNLIEEGLEQHHWFMTKQTMSDYYFPYYVAYVVDTYATKHKEGQNFSKYYTYCFKNNPDTLERFPKQGESENTYRNAIVAEFLGLIERHDSQYKNAKSTEAYKRLSAYIQRASDVDVHREIVDRQIEKICLNVITTADKYKEVKSVTIFPVIFLYKILLGLYDIYKDSRLTHEEFSIFVIRTKDYADYNEVIDLIKQYREHSYGVSYDGKIQEILNHQSTKNVRFDALFGSLKHIEYKSNDYFRIVNEQDSYEYIRNTVQIYETSELFGETDKSVLSAFMRSDLYFKGTIDNVQTSTTVSSEQFLQMVEQENSMLNKLKALAEEYGEDGTTSVTSQVRLATVQQAFRDKLIETQGQKCLLCGITNKEMLVASHIKDAAKCDIYEKADFNNGLLLCANHDKLFDRFLISFNFYDGKIKISKCLTDVEKEICMLDESYVLPKEILTMETQGYLMWHNEEFEKRETER